MAELGPHVPALRVLLKPFSMLPAPAFLLPFSIKMPIEPSPLIVAL
jgi:hypothetical protein